MFVFKKCLEIMFKFLKGKNIVVAPMYINFNKNLSKIYYKPKSSLLKIYHWLINSKRGFAPGTISLSGHNYSDETNNFSFRENDWLAGGAIMHLKKLILKNYYPYNFKRSHCEDILHSLILKKIKLN